ncbi:RNA polymerase sigma factor SigF, partial [Streptomyces sp. SID5770]|nr:RNA polymerase sigma factor SigF [Streptomyces sp. SID5770]
MSPRLDATRTPDAPSATLSVDPTTPLPATPLPGELADRLLDRPLDRIGPVDARALSKDLFARLAELEEGTHDHAYVRNTLVELNLALVRFAAARFGTRSEPMEDIVQVGTIG